MNETFEPVTLPTPIVWMSYADAATYLGRSQRTLRRLVASRRIPHVRFDGEVRFRLEHLVAYVDGCTVWPESGQ